MIDTLLFDLDDTLVAYDAVTDASWLQACSEGLGSESNARAEEAFRAIRKMSDWYWSDEDRHRAGRRDLVVARRSIVVSAFEELGLPESRAIVVADLFSKIRVENMYLLPNTTATLSLFRDQGMRTAIVTNGDSVGQRAKIERFGLAPFFDSVLVEGELGYGKPDPRIYRQVLDRLGSSPERTLMTGDNLVWDVWGAQACGIWAVWFNWKKGSPPEHPKPLASISELSELVDIIRKLNAP